MLNVMIEWWMVGFLIAVGALLLLAVVGFAKRPQGDTTKQVSLGCGSIILIAVMMLVVSSAAVNDLESDVRQLRVTVEELKKSVDGQTAAIRDIQAELKKPRPSGEAQPSADASSEGESHDRSTNAK